MELMNATHVLNEIKYALEALRATGATRTLNILNFPLTNEDAAYLDEVLGRGSLTINYDGADHTFWQEAKISGVWWGEYRNANGKVTLRTLEIAEVPPLVKAQPEDIADGLAHLTEILETQSKPSRRSLPVLALAGD